MPEVTIPPEHPALPGHFPGQPVVPAVVILSEVIGAVRRSHPGLVVSGIRKAKFLARLAPDQAFEIDLGAPAADSVKFACRTGDTVLVQGRLELAAATG